MIIKSTLDKQFKDMIVGLALFPLPVLVLIFTLIKSGHWKDALSAFRGEYTISGVPSNPWREFLPLFSLSILVFVGSSWLATVTAKSSQPTSLKLITGAFLILLASIAFGMSMVFASVSHLWFRDAPVIGSVGSPILFWLSLLLSLVVLIVNCYRLAPAN
jgi:hypothetical protein